MTDHERDPELVTAAAVIPPPRRWTPQGLPPRPARNGNGNLRLNYRPAQPGLQLDGFSLNIDPPPEASGSALMQGLADHAAVVAPLSSIERGSTIGDEGPINEAFLSTPVVRLIAGAHYVLRSAVLVPAGGLLYLNGATISDLSLILLSPGARIADAPRDGRLLHFGDGLIWRADDSRELANLPAGQAGQPYHSILAAAGGVPPYIWTITGTLPPGLHLDVPANWQTPAILASLEASALPGIITLNITEPIPAGSRLLAVLMHNIASAASPQPITDTAGNTYDPYFVPSFHPSATGTVMTFWQGRTDIPLTPPASLAIPRQDYGYTGGGFARLIWIKGGVGGVTAAIGGWQSSSASTADAVLPAPIGDAGQMVLSFMTASHPGSATITDDPAWTPGSETAQLGAAQAQGQVRGITGVNYPAGQPQSPAATRQVPSAWSLASLQMPVSGVPAPGSGIVTIGETALDGTPTIPGSFPLTVTVTDQTGLQDSAQMIVVIAPEPPAPSPPPSIVTFALPAGTVGEAYTAGLAVAGGVPPWTWGAIGLPAGLSLDPQTGIITGTPTTAGSFPVTITVADASGAAAVATFEVDISPAPPPPPGP